MKKPFISVCIPIERKTLYLEEALRAYSQQTYKDFEVVVSSTQFFSTPYRFVRVVSNRNLKGDPATKRNQVLKYGKGEIFVFNDDDVFVPTTYLENVVKLFGDKTILIAGGPLLTPLSDSLLQKASGAVWESFLGSEGAGVYRSRLMSARIVYDYPASNLIVRRDAFKQVGGFPPRIYPGEDTKLCLDICNKFNIGVYYHPNLYVYHHRKPLLKAHLRQIGRYGRQRGRFALSFPETSFKLQYFLPSLFLLYLAGLVILLILDQLKIFLFSAQDGSASGGPFSFFTLTPLVLYISLVLLEGMNLSIRKDIPVALLATMGIVATHLYYGWRFLQSFTGKLFQKLLEYG